ncbi:MAG TPA: hypothetical protein PLD10_18615 [Rhodopila sp.]|nr:hypothetical protein [Rhodopila sp.]
MDLEKVTAIEVPVSPLVTQQIFDGVHAKTGAINGKHTIIRQANAALLPATLERALAGGQ